MSLAESRLLVVDQLRLAGSLESCRNIYPALTYLRLVRDIETASLLGSSVDAVQELKRKWSESDQLPVNDFSYLEPALALRSVMLKDVLPSGVETRGALVDTLLQACRKAREHGNFPVAYRYVTQLSSLIDVQADQDVLVQCRLEKALTEWSRRDVDRAISTLRSLAHEMERDSSLRRHPAYPKALGLLGKWLHETQSENPRQILSDFFQKALDVSLGRLNAKGQQIDNDPSRDQDPSFSFPCPTGEQALEFHILPFIRHDNMCYICVL